MNQAVLYETRGPAAWLTLNQPERRNALSDAILAGLSDGLHKALADDAVRAIVLTGAGSAFCAGADLKSGGVKTGSGENPFVTVMRTIWESPKPVIGRINGHAFGGGIGLAAACDLSVAADGAAFSFSEVRIGVIPAMISVVVLPKIGIQNGDVIQKINGYEMNDPAKAFDIYSKLKDSSSITVDLVRRGKTQTMTYNIR